MSEVRKMILSLDEEDYNTIQTELAKRQSRSRWPDGGVIIPEGESCVAGSLLAEVIRDLDEYRSLHDAKGSD